MYKHGLRKHVYFLDLLVSRWTLGTELLFESKEQVS